MLLHLRDDFPHIAWPAHWSLLGGGVDGDEAPHEAIVRELQEEAGLTATGVTELFDMRDGDGSGLTITFFAGTWDGDETQLSLTEGVELRFVDPRTSTAAIATSAGGDGGADNDIAGRELDAGPM